MTNHITIRGNVGRDPEIRYTQSGDPVATVPVADERACLADGCSTKIHARGLCNTHYRRALEGRPLNAPLRNKVLGLDQALDERLVRRGACIEWIGLRDKRGYGLVTANGRRRLVHRVVWERANGSIPSDVEVDHICHNPSCARLEHLRLATHTENMRNLRGPRRDNRTSRVRNVYWNQTGWLVQITINRRARCFGTYATIAEAKAVADQKRAELFGAFAGRG